MTPGVTRAGGPLPTTGPPAVALTGITKEFRGQEVLHGVDFELRPGEVHALAGSNGSGKSTLMKVIYGAHRPTSGAVAVRGRAVHFRNPSHALKMGIAAVPQELPMVAGLTVAENIYFGDLPRRFGVVRWRKLRERAAQVLAQVDPEGRIDPEDRVYRLDLGQQQLVSIARALAHGAGIVIFDEPTSSLDMASAERLFAVIRGLRDQGAAVGFISQRLDDILAVATRISVLRDGRMVGTMAREQATADTVAGLMVGDAGMATVVQRQARREATPLLQVKDLATGPRVRGLSFNVAAGEVVGLAGLQGSGAEDVLPALLGRRAISAGTVDLGGANLAHSRLGRRIRSGFAYVSGDRRGEGLVRTQTVSFNLTLVLNGGFRLFPISHSRQARLVEQVIASMQIHPPDPAAPVANLSGGNQQKVLIGRWLLVDPRLWLLNDPTRGVDVHARAEIHGQLRQQLATTGGGALMTSSDTRELLEVCDRLLVMARGQIVAELDPSQATEHQVLALAGSAGHQAATGSSPSTGLSPGGF